MLDDDTTDNPESSDPDRPDESATDEDGATTGVAAAAAGLTDIFAPPTPVTAAPEQTDDDPAERPAAPVTKSAASVAAMFQAPPAELAPPKPKPVHEPVEDAADDEDEESEDSEDDQPKRRRRSRGGRRRRKSSDSDGSEDDATGGDSAADANRDEPADPGGDGGDDEGGSTRRRRRRGRSSQSSESGSEDADKSRSAADEVTAVTGSTRLEAKKQRRKDGREAGRRRAPIITEAEFLARRESVDREMVVRQLEDYTQIAVLEDKVLVEHYVARDSQVSIIGNVYLGKVQNVLPSMEAAFVDIGTGRNAVIYAGEVDWSNVDGGRQRKIEDALQPGQAILVQATKDPIGQKGARLTSQISLAGRFLVYVPGGGSNGISRKLPDSERSRLKGLLKEVLPDGASVIVRTAAEGATEDQLTRDVDALAARWADIERKVETSKAPQLLYSEPDLMIKVVRDLFNEDFAKLVVQGDEAWDMLEGYVGHIAPDMSERLEHWDSEKDVFAEHRLDEQIHKALDRKVHLPSGGSLVIDRTEAMTVVDVNTGKFTGAGGNLEETVTKNNLEAADEIVRQLRLRDIGGIIVIDFIDMVLESNRDLVLRRLVECLGRDRTRHQVAEVTSLGLVQMTRKRIGTGLLESFSHECEHCKGRGVIISSEPVERKKDESRRRRSGRGRGGRSQAGDGGSTSSDEKESSANVKKDARDEKVGDDKHEKSKKAGDKAERSRDRRSDESSDEKQGDEKQGTSRRSGKARGERREAAATAASDESSDDRNVSDPSAGDPTASDAAATEPEEAASAPRPKTRRRSKSAATETSAEAPSVEVAGTAPERDDSEKSRDDSEKSPTAGPQSSDPEVTAPSPPSEPVVTTVVKRRTRKAATRPAAAPGPVDNASSGPVSDAGDQGSPALTADRSDQ